MNNWLTNDTKSAEIKETDKAQFSLQNPKSFGTCCRSFRFSNARFIYPYQMVEKFSNATLFRQIV